MIYKGVSIMSLKKKVLLPLGVMSALAAAPVLAADVPYTAVIGGTVTSSFLWVPMSMKAMSC